MTIKFNSFFCAMLFIACGAEANSLDLTGINYVTYGDGKSYSMPFANYQAVGDPTPQPGDPFYIKSTPGEIKTLTVIGTGASGQDVLTNFPGMDNAYQTPSGVSGENFFQTGGLTFGGNTYPAPDPNGAGEFTGDLGNTWDATLDSLSNFLVNDQMVFFFNNNQLNRNLNLQSLAVWSQIWITDELGNVVDPDGNGTETGYFEFTNDNSLYALVSEGGGGIPLGDPSTFISSGKRDPIGDATTNKTDYVLSGGELCLDANGALISCSDPNVAIGPVNHNLGADTAAYAVVFPELNALMDNLFANNALDLTQYTMHIDLRMGCDPTLFGTDATAEICTGGDWGKNLNNGYEQIFIGTLAREQSQIPEPATLVLIGFSLVGFGLSRNRRQS